MIEIRNAGKAYAGANGGFAALSHIDLRFAANSLIAIVGKSTLINLIAGIDRPSYYRFFSTFASPHLAPPLSLGKPMPQLRFSRITKYEERK